MKKLLLGVVLFASLSMTAQYYSITYVSVDSDDIAEFERKETTYWSKVKKAAIDRGEQNLWLLARKVGTAGNNDVNYAFVNGYPSLEAMTSTSWNAESLGFDVQDAMSPYTVYEIHNYKILDQIPGQGGKYSVWNYARPKNMKGFVSENQDLWKPMMEKTIKEQIGTLQEEIKDLQKKAAIFHKELLLTRSHQRAKGAAATTQPRPLGQDTLREEQFCLPPCCQWPYKSDRNHHLQYD